MQSMQIRCQTPCFTCCRLGPLLVNRRRGISGCRAGCHWFGSRFAGGRAAQQLGLQRLRRHQCRMLPVEERHLLLQLCCVFGRQDGRHAFQRQQVLRTPLAL